PQSTDPSSACGDCWRSPSRRDCDIHRSRGLFGNPRRRADGRRNGQAVGCRGSSSLALPDGGGVMSRVRLALGAAVLLLLAPSTRMGAEGRGRVLGPTSAATGFPVGIIDENGVSLQPCLTNLVLCLAGSTVPNVAKPPSTPGNMSPEFFYYV